MIKTYDEALKTLNDIRTYLAINRADDCVQELDKVAKYFINERHKENPSFSDCIKEWGNKGWKVEWLVENDHLKFSKFPEEIYISIKNKDIGTSGNHISFDLIPLIHKTLKALEVEDDK